VLGEAAADDARWCRQQKKKSIVRLDMINL
jgi:hypothetical protein